MYIGVGDKTIGIVETIQHVHDMPFQSYRLPRDTVKAL